MLRFVLRDGTAGERCYVLPADFTSRSRASREIGHWMFALRATKRRYQERPSVAGPRAWFRRQWRDFANRVVSSSTSVRDTVRIELPSALRETPGIVHFEPTPAKA